MPSSEHQSLLNSLPGKIAHIYDNDSIDSYLKHDIACRLIAKSIGANSVSILLYSGPTDNLFCAGRYMDPNLADAHAVNGDEDGQAIIRVMGAIDIIEFLRMRFPQGIHENPVKIMKDLYELYKNFEFTNPVPLQFDFFSSFVQYYMTAEGRKIITSGYDKYIDTTREDTYPVSPPIEISLSNPGTITGAYYYALTHSNNFEEFKKLLPENDKLKLEEDQIIVVPLTEVPHEAVSTRNLTEKLHVKVKSDTWYIGMQLLANRRPIGILRLSLNEQVVVETTSATSDNYSCDSPDAIVDYVKKIVTIQGMSYMLALLVDNVFYTEGMRDISLKDSLKGNVNDLKEIADELTKIINCYGCIIRLSDSNGKNAEIKGSSKGLVHYLTAIEKYGDPYITHEGSFHPVLTKLLYKTNNDAKRESNIDIRCLKIDFDDLARPSYSYAYLGDNSRLVLSKDKDMLKISNNQDRKDLEKIFSSVDSIFKQFDIRAIILIPIKDWKYGFVAFANTSNLKFITKDVEMLIPVVNRLSLAIKYDSDLAKAENYSREKIRDSQRVIYHQILSPILSMRNSLKYLSMLAGATNNGGGKKSALDLRMEEIINTLENTVDFVKVNQFLSDYLSDKTNMKPDLKPVPISSFIIEKARTYQPHARLHRGIGIHVELVDHKHRPIDTDKVLLTHIIQALIDNAIKYSYTHSKLEYFDSSNPIYAPSGVPDKVNVFVEYFDKQREYAITVENWGLRIKDEERSSLTEYLRRGEDAKKFDTNGTGIGLFLVNVITTALKGELEIKTNGDNTRISVKFKY